MKNFICHCLLALLVLLRKNNSFIQNKTTKNKAEYKNMIPGSKGSRMKKFY